VEVSNGVQGGPRHGDRVAAALADVVVEERHGPWSIIGANTVKAATPARTIGRGAPDWWRSSLQILAELR
jgi:hypothetical protein